MGCLNCRILLRGEPEGGYTVTVPTYPDCATYGETSDEAIATARETIEFYLRFPGRKMRGSPLRIAEAHPRRRNPCLNYHHSQPGTSPGYWRKKV